MLFSLAIFGLDGLYPNLKLSGFDIPVQIDLRYPSRLLKIVSFILIISYVGVKTCLALKEKEIAKLIYCQVGQLKLEWPTDQRQQDKWAARSESSIFKCLISEPVLQIETKLAYKKSS